MTVTGQVSRPPLGSSYWPLTLKIGSRVAYRYADVEAYENEHYVSTG